MNKDNTENIFVDNLYFVKQNINCRVKKESKYVLSSKYSCSKTGTEFNSIWKHLIDKLRVLAKFNGFTRRLWGQEMVYSLKHTDTCISYKMYERGGRDASSQYKIRHFKLLADPYKGSESTRRNLWDLKRKKEAIKTKKSARTYSHAIIKKTFKIFKINKMFCS